MAANNSEPLIDSVYARLRDRILSDVLRAGQKLVDRDLADQLGVSVSASANQILARVTRVAISPPTCKQLRKVKRVRDESRPVAFFW